MLHAIRAITLSDVVFAYMLSAIRFACMYMLHTMNVVHVYISQSISKFNLLTFVP